jgi:hypothetical protein
MDLPTRNRVGYGPHGHSGRGEGGGPEIHNATSRVWRYSGPLIAWGMANGVKL